jgi:hypothetical protein
LSAGSVFAASITVYAPPRLIERTAIWAVISRTVVGSPEREEKNIKTKIQHADLAHGYVA